MFTKRMVSAVSTMGVIAGLIVAAGVPATATEIKYDPLRPESTPLPQRADSTSL